MYLQPKLDSFEIHYTRLLVDITEKLYYDSPEQALSYLSSAALLPPWKGDSS
ncbi:hypothetical protein HMPREF9148_01828 [Prevotella sp. F0091]|nr:hypothetical protein HMPREF9148_01828 [Prevotella sp. F0091]